MKSLLTALALLILGAVPAYAWEEGKFLCKPFKFADGSETDEPALVTVEADQLVVAGVDSISYYSPFSSMKRPPIFEPHEDNIWQSRIKYFYSETDSINNFFRVQQVAKEPIRMWITYVTFIIDFHNPIMATTTCRSVE